MTTTTPTSWSSDVVISNDLLANSPRILALDDGTFVLTWQSSDGDIHGRHLNEMGSFTGGDFLSNVTTSSTLSFSTPIATKQAGGGFVVSYTHNTGNNTTDDDVLWYDGNSGSTWHTVNSGFNEELLDSTSRLPSTTTGGGGAIAYNTNGPGGTDHLVMMFTAPNGDPASNPIYIDSSTARTEQNPALTGLHTGFVAIAYESVSTSTFAREIRLQVYKPDDDIHPLTNITVSATNANAAFPDIVELANGNFVVTWQQNDGIAFKMFTGNGTPLGNNTPTFIPGTTGGLVPKITPLNDQGFMIAWEQANGQESDHSANMDLYLQRFNSQGGEVGSTIHMNEPGDQGGTTFNIATLTDGRVVLTFDSETGDSTNLHTLDYRIFDPRETTINGNFGNDNIVGRLEASTLNGFDGNDKLTGMGQNDVLVGGIGNDYLIGGGGKDRLDAGDGIDVLQGGLGADTLIGGAGKDTFNFRDPSETTVAIKDRDTIKDFKQAEGDTINLHEFDANSLLNGNQDFTFIGGQGFHHHAGELRVTHSGGDTFVFGDLNGDAVADFSIKVQGNINLQQGDFAL